MKTQSPAHRMIQLRRKTEKIVIPKMSWDLSNKENNNNITNLYDTSKSKNSSSKKISVDKKSGIRKNLSMTQNTLKCTLKKVSRNENLQKEKKQISLQKRQKKKTSAKKQMKSFVLQGGSNNNNFQMELNILMKKAHKKQPIDSLKQAYCKCLTDPICRSEQERSLACTMAEHIMYWIERCESLQQILNMVNQRTPKMQMLEETYDNQGDGDQQRLDTQFVESQASSCCYIVDPKQQIKMKPIKKQLKELLHLNFEKVDYLRKKQL